LHSTVGDVVEELAQAFPGRTLLHERQGEGECVVDADRVSQLAGNLVANAMTYGDPASPVTVRSVITDAEFKLSVHNLGLPIPPDRQAALFEPMVRGAVEGMATRSVGLGLFIVSEIAKAHGGRMEVLSSEAEGTTFTATLPRRPPAAGN
jgi:sigma-B regulation protein RsbU (phosphoserine phosphatase)